MTKDFSVRKYEKNTFNNYGYLVSVIENSETGRAQTMKFSNIEDARAKANEILLNGSDDKSYTIPYCKIYEGRKCVETIEA